MISNSVDLPLPHPWVNQTSAPRAVILLYHSISKTIDDPLSLSVSEQNFRDHLRHLKEAYNPIKLSDLPAILQRKNLQPKTVIITLDDGYSDLLSSVLPVLQDININATAFMCGGLQNEIPEYWWDTLHDIFLQPGILPAKLRLEVKGEQLSWELGPIADYSPQTAASNRHWNIHSEKEPNQRQLIYKHLHKILRTAPENESRKLLDELKIWSGQSRQNDTVRMLSRHEIADLVKSGHLEIGGHTVSHSFLPGLSADEQKKQIFQNKEFLEDITKLPVESFAYPYGGDQDYTAETIDLVREAGYKLACSSNPDVVWNGSPLWTLNRIMIRDCNGDTFARWLKNWL